MAYRCKNGVSNKEFAWPCFKSSLIVCIFLHIKQKLTFNPKTYNTYSTGFDMLEKTDSEQ